LSFVNYANALANWLEPYHDYARPPPAVVLAEAAKQTELKTGYPLKGVDLSSLDGLSTNGNGKKDEELPTVIEPPQNLFSNFLMVREVFVILCAPLMSNIRRSRF
jgi:N-terminal acetyltransferase B complex non-catalytic subunit